MDRLDRLLIHLAVNGPLKTLAFLVFSAIGLWLLPPWGGLAGLLVPLLDIRGAMLVRHYMPAFEEDLREDMTAAALGESRMAPGETHHEVVEFSGSIDHWLLRRLPSHMTLTLFAPKRDYVVIARREGRIFPPLDMTRMTYAHTDLGSRDVYYADVVSAEMNHGLVRLHMLDGNAVEYQAEEGGGEGAVEELRKRLRTFKASR